MGKTTHLKAVRLGLHDLFNARHGDPMEGLNWCCSLPLLCRRRRKQIVRTKIRRRPSEIQSDYENQRDKRFSGGSLDAYSIQ